MAIEEPVHYFGLFLLYSCSLWLLMFNQINEVAVAGAISLAAKRAAMYQMLDSINLGVN